MLEGMSQPQYLAKTSLLPVTSVAASHTMSRLHPTPCQHPIPRTNPTLKRQLLCRARTIAPWTPQCAAIAAVSASTLRRCEMADSFLTRTVMQLRCDSASPECLNCTQRQVDCTYPAAPAGQTVPTDSAMSTPRSSRMSLGEAKCYLEVQYASDRAGSKDPTPKQRKSLSETTGLSDDVVRLW